MNINPIFTSTQAKSAYRVDDISDDIHIFDPENDEVASSAFWQRPLPEGFETKMARNAILFAWRSNAIDSATALQALIANDALDFDATMELLDRYTAAQSVLEV